MKATKRLIKACVTLIVSVVLCVGICFAWFATKREVDADGLKSNIRGSNIKTFTVAAYNLKSDEDVAGRYSVEGAVPGSVVDGVNIFSMPNYGGIGNDKTTALLLEFTYSFYENLGKSYTVYAECQSTNVKLTPILDTEKNTVSSLNCALSSVVSFYGIKETPASKPAVVNQDAQFATGEMEGNADGSIVKLNADAISDTGGTARITFYCIIDYDDTKIYNQLVEALEIEGATALTPLHFVKDIDFYMSEDC